MSKKEAMDFGPAVAFLEEHSSTNDKGTVVLNRAGYLNFMQERGLNRDVLEQHQAKHEELYGAMTQVAGTRLCTRIAEAKAAGDDPRELTQVMDTSMLGGTARIEIKAHTTSPNPRHAEHGGPEKIERIGSTTLKLRFKSSLPSHAVSTMQSAVASALGDLVAPKD